VALQPDGKIVAVGSYNSSDTGIVGLFIRLTTAGQFDTAFAGNGYMYKQFATPPVNTSEMVALAMDPRGKLVSVGSTLEQVNGNLDVRAIVARVITDVPPSAAFSATPNPALPGQAVGFDGSASTDPDGTVTDWSWSFGDGSTATGPQTSHAYATAGTYTATLTVRDDYGQTSTSSQAVTVNTPVFPGLGAGAASPLISAFAIKPGAFSAASKGGSIAAARKPGAVVSYTDTMNATTTFTVSRAMPGRKRGKHCVKPTRSNAKAKRCTRYVRIRGSFKHVDNAGKNSFRITGRINRNALKPGRYRLTATPKLLGKTGKAVSAPFQIVRTK
jgi:PKD repeat protein